MLVNVVAPTGLTSPRGYFNLDWITLLVMVVSRSSARCCFLRRAGPDRGVGRHLHDEARADRRRNAGSHLRRTPPAGAERLKGRFLGTDQPWQ